MYVAALIIALFGAGATILIVNTAYSTAGAMDFATVDLSDPHVDFKY